MMFRADSHAWAGDGGIFHLKYTTRIRPYSSRLPSARLANLSNRLNRLATAAGFQNERNIHTNTHTCVCVVDLPANGHAATPVAATVSVINRPPTVVDVRLYVLCASFLFRLRA